MVRPTSIFSWSSEKESNSFDIGRSWTLGRPQSLTAQRSPQKTDPLNETAVYAPGGSKAVCISSDECTMNRKLPENSPQLSGPAPNIEPKVPNSGIHEPFTFLHTSGYSSRRFTRFKTLFRSRKHRRRRLDFEIRKDENIEDTCDGEVPRGSSPAAGQAGGTIAKENQDIVAVQLNNSPKAPLGDDEIRKVSHTTEKSVDSSTTSATVCRHPSKRMSMPITVVDRDLVQLNPFDDTWEASRSETNVSNPFTEQRKTTESTGLSSSGYSGSDNPFSSLPGHLLELSSSSHSSWCCPTMSGFNGWPTPADRCLATDSFNKIAGELYLEPLGGNRDISRNERAVDEISAAAGDRLERRRDRLLGRIRTMRSTIQIKAEPSIPRVRSLRRMKTFTALPTRPCLMTSLQGKPLETLARLGGYGFLTLPGDFAPTTLSLPVCFVATINYLRFFAPAVHSLFVDTGDLETATQTYHHFADQVLSAEKERIKIHMTMRSSRMPSFVAEVSEPDTETQNSQVLGIAFTFRALLAGLPGGILGSMQLYRVLVNICHGRISSQSVQRTGSCLAGLSAQDYAKVRAMSLSMLALTSSMQLNLICGVFGLCSLLLHETERMSELERRQHGRSNRRPIASSTDKLGVDRLAATLGPLLIEAGRSDSPDTFHAIQEEIESQRVAALLITNWRSVSRQLRIWERRGLEGRVHAGPVVDKTSGEKAGEDAGT
ncbi:hypothetical protein BJX76DRAFT_76737 [Aspergillus varians]